MRKSTIVSGRLTPAVTKAEHQKLAALLARARRLKAETGSGRLNRADRRAAASILRRGGWKKKAQA